MYYIRVTWMNDFKLDLADCYIALLEMNIMGLLHFRKLLYKFYETRAIGFFRPR